MVYISELERFGYTISAVGRTAAEAEKAVLKAYCTAYKNSNGVSPKSDKWDGVTSYYDIAKEEIYTRGLEFGEVEWK